MALVTEKPTAVFDTEQIQRGDLLWGRHRTWSEGKAGFVTAVTKEQLTVQYYPGIGNVSNHFHIPVSEAIEGQWEIRYSADMTEVQEYGIKVDESQPEMEGGEDGES